MIRASARRWFVAWSWKLLRGSKPCVLLLNPEVSYTQFHAIQAAYYGEPNASGDIDVRVGIFPEFKQTSLLALLWRLSSVASDRNEAFVITRAAKQVGQVLDLDKYFMQIKRVS